LWNLGAAIVATLECVGCASKLLVEFGGCNCCDISIGWSLQEKCDNYWNWKVGNYKFFGQNCRVLQKQGRKQVLHKENKTVIGEKRE
jgi:hypothetical protein